MNSHRMFQMLMSYFVVSSVPADGLNLSAAKTSADTAMTMFELCKILVTIIQWNE